MPPIVLTVVAIIELAAKAGPVGKQIYEQGKALFAMLFAGGLISAETQNALNEWAVAHEAATLRGEVPPALTVE